MCASKKEEIVFQIKVWIDFLLPKVFLLFATLWFAQSAHAMVNEPFSAVHLWLVGLPMHATTGFNLTLLYIVNHFFFRTFIPGHMRVARALLFTTCGVFFYDFIWALLNFVINEKGLFILPLTSFVAVLGFMWIINKTTFIINLNWKYIAIAFTIYFISLAIFINSGFFQQFGLYEQGLASDPHGLEWVFNKTASLWMWLSIANR